MRASRYVVGNDKYRDTEYQWDSWERERRSRNSVVTLAERVNCAVSWITRSLRESIVSLSLSLFFFFSVYRMNLSFDPCTKFRVSCTRSRTINRDRITFLHGFLPREPGVSVHERVIPRGIIDSIQIKPNPLFLKIVKPLRQIWLIKRGPTTIGVFPAA